MKSTNVKWPPFYGGLDFAVLILVQSHLERGLTFRYRAILQLMTTLLREAVEALAQMPEDMQEQAARVIIEFVTALNTAPYAEGL